MSQSRFRRWLKRLRTLYGYAALVVFLVFLLEIGTRLALHAHRAWFVGTPSTPFEPAQGDWRENVHPFFQNATPPADEIDPGPDFAGWRIVPPRAEGAEASRRILFLGGSTSANEYPAKVRDLLEAELGPVTVYNLAASWHTSLHSLYKFWTYVDEIRPDLVVVLHNLNDFCRGFTPPDLALPEYRSDYSHHAGSLNWAVEVSESEIDGRPIFRARFPRPLFEGESDHTMSGLFRGLVGGSTLVHELLDRVGLRGPAADEGISEAVNLTLETCLRALPAFRRNMENLRLSCETKGIPVLFLTMPFVTNPSRPVFLHPGASRNLLSNDGREFITKEMFAEGMRRFNEVVRSLAGNERATVLDLAAEIRDPGLFRDEVHLTAEGMDREARIVASHIRGEGLLHR